MGKIKKSNIEAYSVDEVAACLRKTGRVVPEIPVGDKSPSWVVIFYSMKNVITKILIKMI